MLSERLCSLSTLLVVWCVSCPRYLPILSVSAEPEAAGAGGGSAPPDPVLEDLRSMNAEREAIHAAGGLGCVLPDGEHVYF